MIIKELRAQTGLSQSAFAKKYNIPLRTLQQWEQGRSAPPAYVVGMLQDRVQRPEGGANDYAVQRSEGGANDYVVQRPDAGANDYVAALRLKEKQNWKSLSDLYFKNIERIHPLQRQKVAAVLSEIEHNQAVKKVYVFGSSVNNSCHVGSDLDLYFEMSANENPIKNSYPFEIDALNNFNVDARLLGEIMKKGVVVYG